MPQAATPRAQNRTKRSPSSDMADRLYPEDSQDDDNSDLERQGQGLADDQQSNAQDDVNSVRRTPMSEAAARIYPEGNETDEGQSSDKDGDTSQDGNAMASKGGGGIADAKSQVVQAFLQNNPLANLAHGGVPPATSITEQSEREAKALASLITKIPDQECPLLEKDIGWEKGTIEKMSRAIKENKPLEDYGLVPHADSQGYVNDAIVGKKSYTYQALLKLLESDQWRAFKDKMWEGAGARLTGNRNRAHGMIEKERSEWVLNGMIEAFDKYCKK